MVARRIPSWLFLVLAATVGLAGCEPYMSMTDQIPAQTRQATTLLPKSPRFVGMVDLETAFAEVEEITGMNVADSLRATEPRHVREFLDATGMEPKEDLKAVYGAVGHGKNFSAVLFADLTPAQIDRYLSEASGDAGRSTSYRDVPVYHLAADSHETNGHRHVDSLSLAFMGNGMIAAAVGEGRVEAMVDRFRETKNSFSDNEPYMKLVRKVGRGSTAWLVGRDVLESALRDSGEADGAAVASTPESPSANGASIEGALGRWSDRVLGLSDAPSSFEGRTGGQLERLKSRVREQAVSVTVTDETLDGELYLTMRDEESARNVVDVAKGGIAALRLSRDDLSARHQDLLDEIDVERNGPIVHVTFSIGREHLGDDGDATARGRGSRETIVATHRAHATVRRMGGILASQVAFQLMKTLMTECNVTLDGPVGCNER